MRKKYVISVILTLFLITSLFAIHVKSESTKIVEENISVDYIVSTEIIIQNDNDFHNYPEISGNGSLVDPFVIQNINITNPTGYGIRISDVNSYFEIRDCYILADNPIVFDFILSPQVKIINNTVENDFHGGNGITVNNTDTDLIIQENSIQKFFNGIYAEDSSNLQIDNNYLCDNAHIIQGFHFTNSIIVENLFEENQGMDFSSCSDLDFYNNTFRENEYGINLGSVDFVNIIDNVFIDNWGYAVKFTSSTTDSLVYRNYFIRNGIFYLSQAYFESHTLDVEWHFAGTGNFWSDLDGRTAYPIDGSTSRLDLYPFYNSDDDTLNDYEEVIIHLTDRLDADTDDDSMWDDYEVENNLNPLVDDAYEDADSDMLLNIDEMFHGTDPWNVDLDSDSLSDWYEVSWGLNPLTPNTYTDSDGDGFLDWEEQIHGTKPNNADSDEDGMTDKWEFDNGLDPLVNDAWDDPDNDFLNNFLEYVYGCNPFVADSDGDTHIDSWEVAKGTNPNNPLDFPSTTMPTDTGTLPEETSFSFITGLLTLVLIVGLIFSRKKRIKNGQI